MNNQLACTIVLFLIIFLKECLLFVVLAKPWVRGLEPVPNLDEKAVGYSTCEACPFFVLAAVGYYRSERSSSWLCWAN
jgi:hypothetical protein